MHTAIITLLWIWAIGFSLYWVAAVRRAPAERKAPRALDYVIGLVTQFFDALGIGSFATLSSCYKLFRMVPDEDIPGTMNVGVTLPGIAEGLIFIAVVQVEPLTLALMITAAVLGAWLGAGIVARWPRRKIQIGMGLALLATAVFSLARQLQFFPGSGALLGLTGPKLMAGIAANFVLGALMTLGIGFFAPCMAVIFLLGMDERTAFPIMMGSVAFLGPVASIRFIQQRRYVLKSALGITLAGVPGVLLAAYLVKSLPLATIRWLVVVVMSYTAIMMLRSAAVERKRAQRVTAGVEQIPELP